MKKHGFTLIEVLAIIIILGVLASITYPMVKETIEKNRQKGFAASIDGVVRTTKMYIASNAVSNNLLMSYTDERIKTDNNHFISGTVKYLNGEINLRGFSDGEYCANGVPGNITIEKRECTAEENASVPLDNCFEFDVETRTITRYNYTDIECPKKGVIIPERINGVTIEHIGEHAFIKGVNLANYMVVGSRTRNDVPIYDIIENIGANNNIIESIKKIPYPEPKKKCYTINGGGFHNEVLISTYMDESQSEFYEYCTFDPNLYEEYDDYSGMESIDLSYTKGLKSIDKYAFANGDLRYITFGNLPKLETIDRLAFLNCSISGTLDLSELTGLKRINVEAFAGNKITKVILPDSVRIIDYGAFMNNEIEEINLEETLVLTIGNNAFKNNSLTNIEIPSSILSIGADAFKSNTGGTITINKPSNSVSGNPWGGSNFTVNWTGSN